MLKICDEQRRQALAQRHGLLPAAKLSSAAAVADALLALHATDPASVYLAVAARSEKVSIADIAHALYQERNLLRLLAMRRTMFVLPTALAPIALGACTTTIAKQQRKLLLKHLADVVKGDRERWLRNVEKDTLAALSQNDNLTGQELAKRVPALCTKVAFAVGKSYGRVASITSQVLNVMSAHGSIIRGQPSGGIGSSRYAWNRTDRWLRSQSLSSLPADAARMPLVAAWLRRFGPGTLLDIQWWSGLNKTQVRAALKACNAVEVALDGADSGYLLPDDALLSTRPTRKKSSNWVALLPALDPSAMGWKQRHWYLGEHQTALFDRTGNIGPSIWLGGRIVGGWAQRADGEIATELLQTVKPTARKNIAREAKRLRQWLGEERVTPRFRTPLEKRLTSGR